MNIQERTQWPNSVISSPYRLAVAMTEKSSSSVRRSQRVKERDGCYMSADLCDDSDSNNDKDNKGKVVPVF